MRKAELLYASAFLSLPKMSSKAFEGINCALCIVNCALGEGLDVLDVVFEGVLADSACFES